MLRYQIALSLIPGIGDIIGKSLVAHCGGAEAIFREPKKNLIKIRGVGEQLASAITSFDVMDRAEKEILYMEKEGIRPLFFLDPDYPERLKQCLDGPLMLYYRGTACLNAKYVLSVVGSRNATLYGKGVCQKIISELNLPGLLIVSGLAYGIDAAAHKASLQAEIPTVGVLAHGLDRLYPAQNRKLSERMLEQGGLLTEFKKGSNPDRENFPKRNRIIAGMADAILVVEAQKKSGALITAEIGNSYNRDVFAVPGRVGDEFSQGCNFAIRTNRAAMVESAWDVKYFMNWESKPNKQKTGKNLLAKLNPEEQRIVGLLNRESGVNIDRLSALLELPVSKVSALLLALEFEGLVQSLPGKMYLLV